ncbi:MAG: NAD(P)-dependent oxidoreductase [Tannerella sp.]|jgi:nucleoside-diphosphate-sugar epimerase|nr:NAD(P)-dependent oxidoreductase [Tannerella sp.]
MTSQDGKKVLITGANGFIGRHIVCEALARGYGVWAGVRAVSSLAHLPQDRIHRMNLEYGDPQALTGQLSQFVHEHGAWDYVVHNAGLTKTTHPRDFFHVNAVCTHHLLEALARANCRPRKFLLMSSLGACGAGNQDTLRPIGLDDPQQPDTVYGKSKLMAENHVRAQQDFPYVILRPTGVYGPGDTDYLMEINSIRAGFDFAVGRQPQHLTFIYVKDLASVVFDTLENAAITNRSFFVADGDVHTDAEFARTIQDILQKKHVFRLRIPLWLAWWACICFEGVGRLTGRAMTLNSDKYKILRQRNWICDTGPLHRETGFTPAYNLRRGLEETIRTIETPQSNKQH